MHFFLRAFKLQRLSFCVYSSVLGFHTHCYFLCSTIAHWRCKHGQAAELDCGIARSPTLHLHHWDKCHCQPRPHVLQSLHACERHIASRPYSSTNRRRCRAAADIWCPTQYCQSVWPNIPGFPRVLTSCPLSTWMCETICSTCHTHRGLASSDGHFRAQAWSWPAVSWSTEMVHNGFCVPLQLSYIGSFICGVVLFARQRERNPL